MHVRLRGFIINGKGVCSPQLSRVWLPCDREEDGALCAMVSGKPPGVLRSGVYWLVVEVAPAQWCHERLADSVRIEEN